MLIAARPSLHQALSCLRESPSRQQWEQSCHLIIDDIRGWCKAMRLRQDQIDDAVQEVMLLLPQRVQQFQAHGPDPDRAARNWLRCLTTSTVLTILRSNRRRLAREDRGHELPQEGAGPEVAMQRQEATASLHHAMATLPAAQRLAIELRHLQELSFTKVAEQLNCPVGTAKTHVHRGMQTLRQRLHGHRHLAVLLSCFPFLRAEASATDSTPDSQQAIAHIPSPGVVTMTSTCLISMALVAISIIGIPTPHAQAADPDNKPTTAQTTHPAGGGDGDGEHFPAGDPPLLWQGSESLSTSFTSITPVLSGKHLVAAGKSTVVCVNTDSGKQLWSIPVQAYHHRPLIKAGIVYIADYGTLRAVGLQDGKELWIKSRGALGLPTRICSSPIALDEVLYLACYGHIAAIDSADGAVLWSTKPADPKSSAAYHNCAVTDTQLVVTDWRKAIESRSLVDGSLQWRQDLPDTSAYPPVHADGLWFCIGGNHISGGYLSVLNAKDGTEAWRVHLPDSTIGSPVILKEVVAVSTKKEVIGIDRVKQAVRWRHPRKRFGYECLIADDQGRIILGGDDGELMVCDGNSGELLFKLDIDGMATKADAPMSDFYRNNGMTSRIHDGKKNKRIRTGVFKDGHQKNGHFRSVGALGPPLPGKDRLYVTTSSGWLAALSLPGMGDLAQSGHVLPVGDS